MMKIARYGKQSTEWPYEVRLVSDVPDAKRYPSEGCAIAVAMQKAGRAGGTVTVFEHGDAIVSAVSDEHGTVTLQAPR